MRNINPSEIKNRLGTWRHVIQQVIDGLDGKPFFWSAGELEAHRPKLLTMGITLITKTQIEKRGYRLKKNVKPVGNGYFRSPISRSADLYILECQCVPITNFELEHPEKSEDSPGIADRNRGAAVVNFNRYHLARSNL